jgi:hypothetical protein
MKIQGENNWKKEEKKVFLTGGIPTIIYIWAEAKSYVQVTTKRRGSASSPTWPNWAIAG